MVVLTKTGNTCKHPVNRHKLDKGAATKLEEAMSMREAMGKDVEKDIVLLDEHLTASNKPSALVSMKLFDMADVVFFYFFLFLFPLVRL